MQASISSGKHLPSGISTGNGPGIQNKEIERTFTGDFELYDSQSTNDENSIVKIYVAIK